MSYLNIWQKLQVDKKKSCICFEKVLMKKILLFPWGINNYMRWNPMFMWEWLISMLFLEIYTSVVHCIEYFLLLYDVLTIVYVCYKTDHLICYNRTIYLMTCFISSAFYGCLYGLMKYIIYICICIGLWHGR